MPPGDAAVRLERRGQVVEIVLDRPPANALGDPIVEGLGVAVDDFLASDAKVAVVRSAVPGFFAAGADIKKMVGLGAEGFVEYRDKLRAPLERLAACGRPTIAAIDGLALGGGLELACACTLRLATPTSRLGVPEIKIGLIPGAGGTQRLPGLIGRGRALDLLLTGREVPAEEALAIGLVDRLVVEDVAGAANALADELAGSPRSALEAILALVPDVTPDGMAAEGEAIIRMVTDGEGREGLAAFVEKRRPAFR